MGKTRVKVKINSPEIEKITKQATQQALEDVTDDLANTSSQAAPKEKGLLEGSFDKRYRQTGNNLQSEVIFEIEEGDSDYNYAAIVHNTHPVGGIGPETRQKSPAQSGITHRTFEPGGQYLTRPLNENAKEYFEYIEKEVNEELRSRG